MIKIGSREEMDEFSLYCIVEGDTFTMPLAREEYILDVTTELQKNEQVGPRPEPGIRASQTQGRTEVVAEMLAACLAFLVLWR